MTASLVGIEPFPSEDSLAHLGEAIERDEAKLAEYSTAEIKTRIATLERGLRQGWDARRRGLAALEGAYADQLLKTEPLLAQAFEALVTACRLSQEAAIERERLKTLHSRALREGVQVMPLPAAVAGAVGLSAIVARVPELRQALEEARRGERDEAGAFASAEEVEVVVRKNPPS
jgi:hypothetical protein